MGRSSVLRDDRARARGRTSRPGRERQRRALVNSGGSDQSSSSSRPPTHAGGVVFRRDGATLRYLVVTSNTESRSWVLPKGRIEAGEETIETAYREVLEESGVRAAVLEPLDTIEFVGKRGPVRAEFFLMELLSEGDPSEDRDKKWLELSEALDALSFPSAQELILKADALARK
jgi:8-oxo-dGTP pyrophosphatase MutT (NUDIX family)